MGHWRFYFPDDGEGPDDCAVAPTSTDDAKEAALFACKFDYRVRDGWDRGQSAFEVVVISPDGAESRWTCSHQCDVRHEAIQIRGKHGPG